MITLRSSGNIKSSAVPVVCVSPSGATISALGSGNEVRCGFWDNAASIARTDDGGVTKCIS